MLSKGEIASLIHDKNEYLFSNALNCIPKELYPHARDYLKTLLMKERKIHQDNGLTTTSFEKLEIILLSEIVNLYLKESEHRKALETIKKILKLDPKNAYALHTQDEICSPSLAEPQLDTDNNNNLHPHKYLHPLKHTVFFKSPVPEISSQKSSFVAWKEKPGDIELRTLQTCS